MPVSDRDGGEKVEGFWEASPEAAQQRRVTPPHPTATTARCKAEVPMAEILDYAPDLRSISGGRADYTMEFERYEEVPGHLAAKVVDSTGAGAAVSG
jgi:translation elongation factor EF-G